MAKKLRTSDALPPLTPGAKLVETRTREIQQEPEIPEMISDFPLSDSEQELQAAMDALDGGSDAVIQVYKVSEDGKAGAQLFCFAIPVADFDLTETLIRIQRKHGGGDYRFHLRGKNESGRNVILANKLFSVAAPEITLPGAGNNDGSLAGIFSGMMQQQQAFQKELMETMRRGNGDPLASLTPAIALLSQVKELFAPNGVAAPQGSILTQLKDALAVRDLLKGESPGEGEGFGMSALAPLLLGIVEQLKNGKTPTPIPGQLGAPIPSPAPVAQPLVTEAGPIQPQPVTENNSTMRDPISQHLGLLIQAAKNNGNPETYAEMVLDFTPENQLNDLITFMGLDTAIDYLVSIYPGVATQREWFENLRTAILESFADGGEDELPGDLRQGSPLLLNPPSQPGNEHVRIPQHDPDTADTGAQANPARD